MPDLEALDSLLAKCLQPVRCLMAHQFLGQQVCDWAPGLSPGFSVCCLRCFEEGVGFVCVGFMVTGPEVNAVSGQLPQPNNTRAMIPKATLANPPALHSAGNLHESGSNKEPQTRNNPLKPKPRPSPLGKKRPKNLKP